MRRFTALAAVAALAVVAAIGGGCGSIIPIPDLGAVVLGCNSPSYCFLANCSCNRKDAQGGSCTVPVPACANPPCQCPRSVPAAGDDMGTSVQCQEVAQACIGRGSFCGGMGARCLPAGSLCSMSGGDPPQLVATDAVGPALEPHCQFVDDVCCAGVDGGATD